MVVVEDNDVERGVRDTTTDRSVTWMLKVGVLVSPPSGDVAVRVSTTGGPGTASDAIPTLNVVG